LPCRLSRAAAFLVFASGIGLPPLEIAYRLARAAYIHRQGNTNDRSTWFSGVLGSC
jgi:hypothetical protein